MSPKQPPPEDSPHEANAGPWIRSYLLALLADPALNPPESGALPIALEQQVDPAVERGQATSRMTIQHAVQRSPAMALLGPAGSGKSTLLRGLVRELAQEALAHPKAPLPLYVPLTFFAGSIEGALAAQARMRGPSLATLALTRPCILIVDALNDVPAGEQMSVLGLLHRALSKLGPQGRWIFACRSEAWYLFDAWFPSGGYSVWRIRPWNDQEIWSAVQRQGTAAGERLLRLPGAIELARRPRWLAAFLLLRDDLLPGPLLLRWIGTTAAEAARTHCLSDQCAEIAVPLLQDLGDVLVRQTPEDARLNQATTASVVVDAAAAAGLHAGHVHAMLHALALLQQVGDDEWSFRSPLLADLNLALDLRAEFSKASPDKAGARETSSPPDPRFPAAAALLFGLVSAPQTLLLALLHAGAWEATQQVLDANAAPDEALAYIEESDRISPFTSSTGAALGRAWALNGSPEVAIALLEWTVKEGRDDSYLFGLIGRLHLKAGRWSDARAAYEEALRREPPNLEYQQALAHICQELGEADTAATTFKDLLEQQYRQAAEAAFRFGALLEQQEKLVEALEAFTRAATLCTRGSANEAQFQLAQARILRRLGRHEEAGQTLRAISETVADPIALSDENAALLEATGHDQQALERLGQIEDDGGATPTTFIRMAELHRRRDELDAADRAYRAAVELDPRREEAYAGIADLAAKNEDFATAVTAYEKIVELQPLSATAWRRLGALQRRADRLVDSARSLQTSLRLEQSPETQLELARTRWAQGDQITALSHYRSASAQDPDGRMTAEAGWALLEIGDLVNAQATLERAVDLRPADGRVLYDLGRCYEAQGASTRALEWYMQAAHVAPSASTFRATGRAARVLGERAMARQMLGRALRADRANGDTAAEIARLHLQDGRADQAASAFRRARVAGIEDLEVLRDHAEALLQLGDANGALAILEAVSVEDNDFQTKRSRAHELLGDPQQALEIARAAAARQPRNAVLQRRVGALALQAGQPGEALVALEAARTLGDKEIATLVDLSRAMLQTGRTSAAMRPVDEALQRIAQGVPDNARVHLQRGRVFLAIEDWVAARRAFERAIALGEGGAPGAANRTAGMDTPEQPREGRLQHAEAWAGLAEAYARVAGPSAALTYARHALELAPAEADFIRLVGRLLFEARDYVGARDMLATERAAEPATLRLRLRVELAAEQWTAAVALAARCHAIMPNDPRVAADYGAALLGAGQPQEASPLLETACASSGAVPAWWATLGRCRMRLNQFENAIPAFTRALEGQPDNARTHADLAGAHMRQGSYAAAAHSLRQALELGGERVELRAALARAYGAQGWLSEALAEWERARRLAPDDPALRIETARARLDLGDPEPALAELEAMVADHPDHAAAWQLLSRAALAAGTPSRAVYAAACALSQKPNDARLRMLLSEAALADGDPQHAYETLLPLIETAEPNIKALLLMHRAANQLGHADAGWSALEKAGRLAPGDPDVQLAIAEHLLRIGETPRAIKALRNLFARHGDTPPIAAAIAALALRGAELGLARQASERAVSLAPQDTSYARLFGRICYLEGDTTMARRALTQALKGRQDPESALILGKLAMGRGEITQAAQFLRLAHDLRADDPETCGWLALALRHPLEPVLEDEAPEPQQAPALEATIQLLRQSEGMPRWRAELGWTLAMRGDYADAVAMLNSAARSDELALEHRVVALRRVGLIMLKQGRAGDARTPLERAHELDPSDAMVCSLLGQIADVNGDREGAIQHYGRAVALQPDNGRHHLRLGLAQLDADNVGTAQEHLERAVELEPARASAFTGLSRALLLLGQLERAAQCAQRAIQLGPSDGAAWRQLAATAEARSDTRAALEALERAIGHAPSTRDNKAWLLHYARLRIMNGETERGRAALQSASDLDPNDAELLYELSQLYGAGEQATYLQQAVELRPDQTAWRTELARLLIERGDHRAALDHLQRAIASEPRRAASWLTLAQAYRKIGDDAAAEKALERGDAEAGPNPDIFAALGQIFETRERWDEALSAYLEALELQSSADRHTDCGRCLKMLERYDDAQHVLQSALDQQQDHAPAHTLMAEVYLLHDPQGGWKAAINHARKATDLAPTDLAGYKLRARAALGGHWDDEVEAAIEHARALEPDDPELYELQGWYHLGQGNIALALEQARQAVEHDPNSASAHYLLGEVLKRDQRILEAIPVYRKVLELNGNYIGAFKELAALTVAALMNGNRK